MSTHVQQSDVRQLDADNRFVLLQDGGEIGLIDYRIDGSNIHLIHTEIDPHLRGDGLGEGFVREVLDRIRRDTELSVVADCPFVADFLQANPAYRELEASGQ